VRGEASAGGIRPPLIASMPAGATRRDHASGYYPLVDMGTFLITVKPMSTTPQVKLTQAFGQPFLNAVATARTCYSSKGIIDEASVGPHYLDIAESIYRAGHHTTLQHANFQFSLDNVSRQFIWSFLHNHPFYNSEQVSQRYVKVEPDKCYTPPLEGEALSIYEKCLQRQHRSYQRLCESLAPLVEAELLRIFPKRSAGQMSEMVNRRAWELARYVLPVATLACLYHTINGITLMRYYRMCQAPDTPSEQRAVVEAMIAALLDHDPLYREILEEPLQSEAFPENAFEPDISAAHRYAESFDAELGGRVSLLTGYKTNNEELLADAVREVLGRQQGGLSNEEAINLALCPATNKLLSENMNLSTHGKLQRAMAHPSYTFKKKLSHSADSQDQRHRMTPASRPVLAQVYTGQPDYITPELISQDEKVLREYQEELSHTWEDIEALRRQGVGLDDALYLLPNAVSIRFSQSSDLLNLHHKHAMRLCLNAQEEIWRASRDEAEQIREIEPLIGKHLLPPCTHRAIAGKKPACPEGKRFCGVVMWKMNPADYNRVI
jgi:thymidylate synthase ThyX